MKIEFKEIDRDVKLSDPDGIYYRRNGDRVSLVIVGGSFNEMSVADIANQFQDFIGEPVTVMDAVDLQLDYFSDQPIGAMRSMRDRGFIVVRSVLNIRKPLTKPNDPA